MSGIEGGGEEEVAAPPPTTLSIAESTEGPTDQTSSLYRDGRQDVAVEIERN